MNITSSEQILMEILWSEAPLTVGQLIERAQKQSDWHDNTIKTMLIRLTKKQAVSRIKDGKRFFYSPAVSRDDVIIQESEGFLSRFFDGRMAPFIAHFAKNKSLSQDEIKEIEKIIQRMKKDG